MAAGRCRGRGNCLVEVLQVIVCCEPDIEPKVGGCQARVLNGRSCLSAKPLCKCRWESSPRDPRLTNVSIIRKWNPFVVLVNEPGLLTPIEACSHVEPMPFLDRVCLSVQKAVTMRKNKIIKNCFNQKSKSCLLNPSFLHNPPFVEGAESDKATQPNTLTST